MSSAKNLILSMLDKAKINLNGDQPWDIKVHNDDLYQRILNEQTLGLGEAYMDGWWDCPKLDVFFEKVLNARLDKYLYDYIFKNKEYWGTAFKFLVNYSQSILFNYQSKSRAFEVGERHYDKGNDLFKAMLDKNLVYTCAYWKDVDNLDDAQIAKLKLVCDKLNLQPGQKILDIGCGWGSFAKYAAQNYGVSVVGITVSKEQKQLADELCQGLPVEIRLQDYRELNETFDHIVSLGMFEHVGYKNYQTYFKVARNCLQDAGLFLLHTIGGNTSSRRTNPWISKYIFPNGMIPSIKQISASLENLFVVEDWHNFGAYYDNTLMAWHANFIAHWDKLKANYDERFKRMWEYYLLSCAAGFRVRDLQLWQIVLSKHGVKGGYQSIR